MSAPVYIQKFDAAALPGQRAVATQSNEASNQAIARFGQALAGTAQVASQASNVFQHVNRATTLANRTSQFFTEVDQLEQQFQNDPDPTTAPARAGEKIEELKRKATDGLGPEDQAELGLKLNRVGISTVGGVRQVALKKQADQFGSDMDVQYQGYQKRYVAAQTDAERKAVDEEWNGELLKGVQRGVMTARQATAYRQTLTKTGDEALILRGIGQNPAQTLKALDDPAQFAGLDEPTRERYRQQARAARDEITSQGIVQEARFNPASATMKIGRVNRVEDGDAIFMKGIIQQESGGNPNAPRSVDGAVSISQMLPDTARAMAKKLGREDVAGLGNLQIQQKLKEDPQLALTLGREYFREGLRATNGSVPAAIAGYHMGVGAAAEVHRKAVAQFGDGYSPEQFASLIPAGKVDGLGKRTADYVRDVYRRIGVDTGGAGLSPGQSWRTQNAIASEIQTQDSALNRQTQALISVAKQEAGSTADILQQGYAADANRLAAIRAPLTLAASKGDSAAMQQLQLLNEAETAAPIVREAYQMKPEALAGQVAQMRQVMAGSADVTPAMMRRLKLFEGVQQEMARARNEDPVGLAIRAGVAPNTVLPEPGDMRSPATVDAIARRSIAMERAHGEYGGEAKFFRPDEAKSYKAAYEQADDTAKIDMLSALAKGASPQAYAAAVRQIAGDSPVLQWAGTLARTDVETARSILRGQQLINDKGTPDPKATELRNALKGTLRGDLFPGEHQGAVIEAALAIYAAERGKSWTLYDGDDRAGLEKALQRAAGGVITRHNGGQTVLPRGMGEAQFSTVWNALDERVLGSLGMSPDFIKRNGQLLRMSADEGKYAVAIPQGGKQRPVLDPDGRPLILDMEMLARQPRYQFGAFSRQSPVAYGDSIDRLNPVDGGPAFGIDPRIGGGQR
jgi:hypothetical protein